MRVFAYEAVNGAGVISRGELAASNEFQLEEQLARRGLTLVRLLLVRTWMSREPRTARVARHDLVDFARYVSVTSKAGLSIVESIGDFAAGARDSRLRATLQRVAEDVRGGMALAEAFGRHKGAFDPIFIAMVRAGEASGTLDDSMLRAADQMAFQQSVRQQVRSALIPPGILAIAVLGLVILLITFLLPRLMAVMGDTGVALPLPLPTRMLLSLSGLLVQEWPVLVGGLLATVMAVRQALRHPSLGLRASRLALRIPAVGPLARMSAEARFVSTMRSLLSSGVDAVRALQMAADTSGSRWMTERLRRAATRIEAGEPLSDAILEVEGMHPLLTRMLQLGEKAGDLQSTLGTAVDWYSAEVPRCVKRTMQFVEPAIVMGAGCTIAFIVLATVLPIFSLYDAIG